MSTITATATAIPALTLQTLTTALDSVTVAQKTTADIFVKSAGGLDAALSSYLRTGKHATARIGALAHVFKGVLETLEYGQKGKLTGFATASKKQTDAFSFAQSIGIVSDTGAVLVKIDDTAKGIVKGMADRAIDFVALALAFEGAAKLVREALKVEKAEPAADVSGEAIAEPEISEPEIVAPLTSGQQDDAAVAYLVSRAAFLSEENREALLAMLAPVVAPARKRKAAPVAAPARKRKAAPVATEAAPVATEAALA